MDNRIHESCIITRKELLSIGSYNAIDPFFYCTTALELGDYNHIQAQVGVIGGKNGVLKLNNFCFISIGSKIICGTDEFVSGFGIVNPQIPEKYKDTLVIKPVIFNNFSGVCTNCIVLPGVTLGEGSVVGAGSLVNKDTEEWTIYLGNPAVPIKKRPKEKIIENAKKMGYE